MLLMSKVTQGSVTEGPRRREAQLYDGSIGSRPICMKELVIEGEGLN